MALFNSHAYDDFLYRDRPPSHHMPMSRADRAKIFSPFAALKGFEEDVEKKQKLRTNKAALSEESKARLNETLLTLKKRQSVTITYFVHDPGTDGSGGYAEGEYSTVTGLIEQLEPTLQFLKLTYPDTPDASLLIFFEDILSLRAD